MKLDIFNLLTIDQQEQLIEAASSTNAAALGDSNDEEIEALQDFRDLACEVLGIDLDKIG